VRFVNEDKTGKNLEIKNSNQDEIEKNKESQVIENKKEMEEAKTSQINTNNIFNNIDKNNLNKNLNLKNENFKTLEQNPIQNVAKSSTNNLDKFKNIVYETSKHQVFYENPSAKRLRTTNDFQPSVTEFDFHVGKNTNNAYEVHKNCAKDYERIIKTSHDQRREGTQFIPNPRLINQKMMESDIFFLSNIPQKKANLYGTSNIRLSTNNKIIIKDYLSSDVFVQKNNEASRKKIGEKYLYDDNKYKKIGYHPCAKSNSEWSPRNQVKSFMNHNSCEYDLFNPYMKKVVFTKEKIQSEANNINPVNRQKSITEFVDLTRNFVPNHNKEFEKAIGKENRIFSKKRELCSNFLELHKEYYNICEKPFIKKFV